MPFDPAKHETFSVTYQVGLTADWDENRAIVVNVTPPPGERAIACSLAVRQTSLSSGSWSARRIDASTYEVLLRAHGSGNQFDQWRGWVKLDCELHCVRARPGVTSHDELACPVTADNPLPAEQGIVTCCLLPPDNDGIHGVIIATPYTIVNGAVYYDTQAQFGAGPCDINSYPAGACGVNALPTKPSGGWSAPPLPEKRDCLSSREPSR